MQQQQHTHTTYRLTGFWLFDITAETLFCIPFDTCPPTQSVEGASAPIISTPSFLRLGKEREPSQTVITDRVDWMKKK